MFYAVYVAKTGQLRSTGTMVANPLPKGLAVKEFAERPQRMDWNITTKDFDIPRPVPPAILTLSEFMNLFTIAEDAAIETAAPTDPMLRVLLRRVLVTQCLDHLVSIGILTPERAAEIRGA